MTPQAVTPTPAASFTLPMRFARKLAHNVIVTAALLTVLMVAVMETPKESVQRPELSERDRAVLCKMQDALNPECP